MLMNLPKATQLSGGGGPGMQLPLGFLSHEWAHTYTHRNKRAGMKKMQKHHQIRECLEKVRKDKVLCK